MPLYQLLGGASREGVWFIAIPPVTVLMKLWMIMPVSGAGIQSHPRAVRNPWYENPYGMSKGKGLAYEPATKGQWRKSSCGRRRNTSISCRNCLTGT